MTRALRALSIAMLSVAPVAAQDDFWDLELKAGLTSQRKGKLAQASEVFEEILASFEEDSEDERPSAIIARRARQGLLALDLVRGNYAEVQAAIEALPRDERQESEYRELLAMALQRRGEYERAMDLWTALLEADPTHAKASYWLGWLQHELGRLDEARATWQAALAVGGDAGDEAVAESLAYRGMSQVALGGRRNIEAASQLLAASIGADKTLPEARVALGLLYFDVYNEAEGHESGEKYLKRVLEENGEVEEALVGLYRIRRSNMQLSPATTQEYLSRALSLNPNSVPALVERGVGLLQDRRFDAAAETLDRALEINPRDKWALAHRAATALVMRDGTLVEQLRQRAFAVDGAFADYHRILGEHLVALYRFADAEPHFRQALEMDPESIPAMHGLAKSLIYTSRGTDAAVLLKRAKELQPGFVDPWRDNALAVEDLLEEDYREEASDGFVFHLHRDDRGVMVEYLTPMLTEARTVLGEKYGYLPPEDVKLEVFHTWDDFSVRTVGFRGFSALGACFGRLITLVSPSDAQLRRQDFMWAATVWHEYAHVLTLALSDHRVPRWLTEGFSVYEERERDRSWERGMDRELLDAYHNGQIAPLRLLNSLFRGPRILFGYYQGGLIVEYLAEKHGFDKVVELLRGYADDRSTTELFESVFGIDTESFDRDFLAFVRDKKLRNLKIVPRLAEGGLERMLDRIAEDPSDLAAHVLLGWAYFNADNNIDAANQVRVVRRQDPEFGPGLLLHAALLQRRGASDEAVTAYERGFATGTEDFDSRVRYATLLETRGDVDGAIAQLHRAKLCWPQCTDQNVAPELLLAALLRKEGRITESMMELKAFVRRTGRAFQPRLDLAAMEREQGNREEEARLLQQAVWIDPFMREVHVELGDALQALGQPQDALREFRVALAVPPNLDREHLGKDASEIPDVASAPERELRAAICLRIARLAFSLDRRDDAMHYLDRVIREVPRSEMAEEASELRAAWQR